MRIPVLRLPAVYHLGSLDRARRGEQYKTSQEGSGLSVSLCPRAWSEIARLGDDLLQLHRAHAAFIDLGSVDATTKSMIVAWAVHEGIIEDASQWRGWDFDAENEEWRYSLYGTLEEASSEVRFSFDVDDDTALETIPLPRRLPREAGSLVERVQIKQLTEFGLTRTDGYGAGMDATDFAIMAYGADVVSREHPDVVGVWWKERLDTARLSAPRGAIFADRVQEFSVEKVDFYSTSDQVLLGRMTRRSYLEISHTAAPRIAL